jgi:hypothetical protein
LRVVWWCWRGDFAVVVKNRCDSGELRVVRSERVKLFFINQGSMVVADFLL